MVEQGSKQAELTEVSRVILGADIVSAPGALGYKKSLRLVYGVRGCAGSADSRLAKRTSIDDGDKSLGKLVVNADEAHVAFARRAGGRDIVAKDSGLVLLTIARWRVGSVRSMSLLLAQPVCQGGVEPMLQTSIQEAFPRPKARPRDTVTAKS